MSFLIFVFLNFLQSLCLTTTLLELRIMEVVLITGAISRAKLQSNVTTNKPTSCFLQAGCPSCCCALLLPEKMTLLPFLLLLTAIFRWTWVSQYQNIFILDFIGAKDDGCGGDHWSCKTCKAPVKSSLPANQHPVFYRPDALLVAKLAESEEY